MTRKKVNPCLVQTHFFPNTFDLRVRRSPVQQLELLPFLVELFKGGDFSDLAKECLGEREQHAGMYEWSVKEINGARSRGTGSSSQLLWRLRETSSRPDWTTAWLKSSLNNLARPCLKHLKSKEQLRTQLECLPSMCEAQSARVRAREWRAGYGWTQL